MSDIDNCRKSVERLTRDRGDVMRAGTGGQAMSYEIEEIRDRVEQDVAKGPANKEIYRVHKDRAFLLAEVDRQRKEVERLRAFEAAHQQLQAVLDTAIRERDEARAETERLTRERGDEARAALKPFANMYLWPDDAGPVTAQRVRSRNGWDEAANDEESHEFWIKRGDIRAARKALEAKP